MLQRPSAPPETFPTTCFPGLETATAESGIFGVEINGEGFDAVSYAAVVSVPQETGTLTEPQDPTAVEDEEPQDQELPEAHPYTQEIPEQSAEDEARQRNLLDAAQQGDLEAYGQLIQEIDLQESLFRFIYYRVGSKELALDLTQETLLRGMRKIATIVDASSGVANAVSRWHVRVAKNLVADHYKSGRVQREVPTGEMLDPDEFAPSPEDVVLEGVSSETLRLAILSLNGLQQQCITLRFLRGLTVAETAKALDSSEGAIKTLQYRAVRTLARMAEVQALA